MARLISTIQNLINVTLSPFSGKKRERLLFDGILTASIAQTPIKPQNDGFFEYFHRTQTYTHLMINHLWHEYRIHCTKPIPDDKLFLLAS